MFVETRGQRYQAPMLLTHLYWRRSNTTFLFPPCSRDVCQYVLHGTGAFISLVSGQASAGERASPLDVSVFQSTPCTDRDETRRDESALWKCSQRANDLGEMHCGCSSAVRADFSEYFGISSLTRVQSPPAVKFGGSKSCLHRSMRGRPALLPSALLCPVIFIPLPPRYLFSLNVNGQLTPFPESTYKYLFGFTYKLPVAALWMQLFHSCWCTGSAAQLESCCELLEPAQGRGGAISVWPLSPRWISATC